MSFNSLKVLLPLGLLFTSAAQAQSSYPEDGWWWDPQAPGRGYLMERQGEEIFIAAFHYAESGDPQWLSSSGGYAAVPEDQGIGEYIGTTWYSSGGQCPGCPWQAASAVESNQGEMSIQFSDNRNGTLHWEGEVIDITRFLWAWNDAVDQLAGDWLLTRLEDGAQSGLLVSISDAGGSGLAEVSNLVTGELQGTIELNDGTLLLMLEDASEAELPLIIPETHRFYAGYGRADALQVVAVRLDDLPMVFASAESGESISPLQLFTGNVELDTNGDTLVIFTDGLPDHSSPYWGEGHDLYSEPHSGMRVNPNRIEEQDLTFRIPSDPQLASQTSDTALGPIGVSVNGVVFYNQYAGVNMTTGEWLPLDDEIGSFDEGNGHPQRTGQYHYHMEPTYLTVADNAAFLGFAMDGFPIYGPRNADGSSPELDECNGESHVTEEYPQGIYHYHITAVEPYILGCYRGEPGTFSR